MQTKKGIKVARTEFKAVTTGLRSKIRLDKLNSFPFSFSLILDETLQLVETPVVKPSVESLAFANLPYSFQVFHDNSVSVPDNALANYMVVVPHEAFLSATQLPKKPFGRLCAFALQPFTQVMKFPNLCFGSFKENSLASYSEVVYSDINTQNPVATTRNWGVDISGKSNVKEHPTFSILNNLKSLVSPVKVFPIILRNVYLEVLPFALDKSGKTDFLKRKSKKVSIKGDRAGLHNRLLFQLSGLEVFRSLCYGFTGKVSRKPFSKVFIHKIVKFKSVTYFSFKTFVYSVLNCFKKGMGHINKVLV